MSQVSNPPPHIYSNVGLDRAAVRRLDDAWLRERRADPSTLVVPMHGLKVMSVLDDNEPGVVMPRLADIGIELDREAVFLGMLEGEAVFAAAIEPVAEELERFVELRQIGTVIPASIAGILAYARALMHWRLRHTFCGACGTHTDPAQGGHARHCSACGLDVFPRTDPAVIVLVTADDHCVLARSPRFPEGMFSTLAGFVEPGESLEQTLVREIEEEVGLRVVQPAYRSSQPWPFPQSLMLGFRARAPKQELTIDRNEIAEADWFSRAELLDTARRRVRLPNVDSIARFLIDEWLYET